MSTAIVNAKAIFSTRESGGTVDKRPILAQINRDLHKINYVFLDGGINGTFIYGGTGNGVNAPSNPDLVLAQVSASSGVPITTLGNATSGLPSSYNRRNLNVTGGSAGTPPTIANIGIVTNANTVLSLDAIDSDTNYASPRAQFQALTAGSAAPLCMNPNGGTIFFGGYPYSTFSTNGYGLVCSTNTAFTQIAYTGTSPIANTKKITLGGYSSNGVGNQIGWAVNSSFGGDVAQIRADADNYGIDARGRLVFSCNAGS